ncbi:MAG: septum site-determining protein MinD [Clostridia bacterium]|nr:septum site-determining protein MinD [Clostridia bacterium]
MGRCIVVTSGKGGVGKSTITATLGVAIAEAGAKTVLVDADVGLNNLDLVLGIESIVGYDVLDVEKGRCRLSEALVAHPFCEDLYLLSSRALSGGQISQRSFANVVNALRRSFDYILIDCPAGIDEGFHRAVSVADEAIIVTTPVPASVRDADKVSNLLASYRLRRVSVVVNRVRGDLVLKGDLMSVEDVTSVLRLPVIGSVPEDDEVLLSATVGKISDARSRHYRAVCMIASNIMLGTDAIYDCTAKYRGIIGFFRKIAR